jgi:SAM-dependent methyltransferase
MNDKKQLIEFWKEEEKVASIKGWDFSHLKGRLFDDEKTLPWDYKQTVLKYLKPEMKVLDIDTGGGEFLLSLGHPNENITVTESYAPNVELCQKTLCPKGINVVNCKADNLPFEDESFDIILNRHGDLAPEEFFRVLKKGGLFVTQQVGAYNDREFVKLLLPKADIPFPTQYLQHQAEEFENAGFDILEENEGYYKMRFSDVGALVWFAKIIEWEFAGFSVEKCAEKLLKAQEIISNDEFIEGTAHRFYFVAQK